MPKSRATTKDPAHGLQRTPAPVWIEFTFYEVPYQEDLPSRASPQCLSYLRNNPANDTNSDRGVYSRTCRPTR